MDKLIVAFLIQNLFINILSVTILILLKMNESKASHSLLKMVVRTTLSLYLVPIYLVKFLFTSQTRDILLSHWSDIRYAISSFIMFNQSNTTQFVKIFNIVITIMVVIFLIVGFCIMLLRVLQYNSLKRLLVAQKSLYYIDKTLVILTNNFDPFATGVMQKIIVLPQNLKTEELDLIFQHEKLHHKNHDIIWKMIVILIKSLFWYCPCTYLKKIRLLQ